MLLKHILNHLLESMLCLGHLTTKPHCGALSVTLGPFTTSQSGVFCRWLAYSIQTAELICQLKDLRCAGRSWASAGRKAKLAWMKKTHGIKEKIIIIVPSAERGTATQGKIFQVKIQCLAFNDVLCKQRPSQKQQVRDALKGNSGDSLLILEIIVNITV